MKRVVAAATRSANSARISWGPDEDMRGARGTTGTFFCFASGLINSAPA